MIEIGGVSGPGPARLETDASEATSASRQARAAVDTEVCSGVDGARASAPELPPSQGPIDFGLAASAASAMSENVGVDFGRIAALMMMIDSELSRAARDTQVADIEEVASDMHKSADDLRASAKMALIGGCVSGSVQIASAGITIAGGAKGMSLTRGSIAPPTEAPAAPVEEAPAAPSENAPAPSAPPPTELGGGVEEPAPVKESAAETRQENVKEMTDQETKTRQKDTTQRLDMAASQQLSARAHGVTLVTQGVSQLTSSTGEIIKSALDYESKVKEAKSKDDEATAERERAFLERTKGFADSMQKGAQDMLQLFQQMSEGKHQTSSQVWSRA